MANNYVYITETGVIVEDTSNVLIEVQNEYKEALSADLDVSSSTPQGRLIAAETKARTTMIRNNAAMANMINPNLAFGVFLDSLCALVGVSRRTATHSTVLATLSGTAGVTIPAGSRAKTDVGDIFYLENDTTIPASGTINAYFIAQESGAVPCPANSLNQIVDPVLGWATITNGNNADLGAEAESDADLKARRAAGLYQGVALPAAIKAALQNVSNVNSFYIYENYTNEPIIKDGITIKPHTIFTVVDGGENKAVAQALFDSKSAGCGYSGTDTEESESGESESGESESGEYSLDVTVNVTDIVSGNTYPVTFSRPDDVNVQVAAEIKIPANISTSQADITAAVKAAILAYAKGDIDGVDKPEIGVEISAFEIASAITAAVPDIFVKTVQIGKVGGSLSYSNIPMNINQIGRFAEQNITVTVA